MVSLFKDWKCRSSSVGKILTKQGGITPNQIEEIKILQNERDLGVNVNGNAVKFTTTKKDKLINLVKIRDTPEALPDGVVTYLNTVFNHIFWKRRRSLKGNQIEKGTEVETDSLQLLSDLDSIYYAENKDQFSNDYLTGEPDNYQFNIKEIKSNYDKESFDNADLTTLYKWQARAYCYLCNKQDAELIYCLVNNPIKQINQAIYYLKLKHDIIDEPTPEFLKEAQQVERNMIFDIGKWNKDYPNYDWYSKVFDFDIPKSLRIKRFPIEFLPEHIAFIKKRIEMARVYLMKKETEELEKIKSHSLEDYNKQIEIIKNRLKLVA